MICIYSTKAHVMHMLKTIPVDACTYYIELHMTQLRILKSDPTFDNSMTQELFIVFSCLDIIHFDQLSLFHSYKLIGNNRIVTKIDIIISN